MKVERVGGHSDMILTKEANRRYEILSRAKGLNFRKPQVVSNGKGKTINTSMQYIRGHNLHDIINAIGRYNFSPTPEFCLALTEKFLAALQVLVSSGVIHRDIKPLNTMVSHSSYEQQVVVDLIKIIDLDSAKLVSDRRIDPDFKIFTPGYAAPETLDGYSDERSDIFSAGRTLREFWSTVANALGGKFDGNPDQEILGVLFYEKILPLLKEMDHKNYEKRIDKVETALERVNQIADLYYAKKAARDNNMAEARTLEAITSARYLAINTSKRLDMIAGAMQKDISSSKFYKNMDGFLASIRVEIDKAISET